MTKKKITEAKDIHISGDFIAGNQIINYYTGDFASLVEYYISPESVFQRVRTDDFIGRDWLTAKVDAFLNDPNRKSGAFLLIGDAGVGKTSFMVHLVKERRYLHLFADQAPGQAMLQRAMQSLGSQLITRYQIDPYKDRDTLNALSVFPDFLERILRLAASTLTEGEKIVIVCDALDEAGVFPDHFVFGLPKELPDGVYFILSQRPVNVKLPNFEPVIENLEALGEGNLQDMEAYLRAVAKRPEVAGQIRAKEYSEEFFIQTLKEKSQGVWMYLHYIIKEIESGARASLDLANLPTGLVGYYAEYWGAWRMGERGMGEEAWDDLYAPLLTTLAAAQEAIPVDWLIQWADVTAKPREVTRLLTEHWRAFITEKEIDGQRTYTPYHLSFKDFITGRVDTDKLPPAQANLVKDLASQTVNAHKRIVSVFETECKGEWEKLIEQDYPRLHLTAHLNGAGEYEKLRILLTEGDEKIKWAEAREQKEETYAGYLNDLTYVWEYAEREQNFALAIRCMLIENSIHSLAESIPSDLLAEIARNKLWSYAKCLDVTRRKVNSFSKADALIKIMPSMPTELFQEIIAIIRSINNAENRTYALASLIRSQSSSLKLRDAQEILLVISDMEDERWRFRLLEDFALYIPEIIKLQITDRILSAARRVEDEFDRAWILFNFSTHLDGEIKQKVLQEVFSIIRKSQDVSYRANALRIFAQSVNEEAKNNILKGALDAARSIKDARDRTCALSKLASSFDEEFRQILLLEALETLREIRSENSRVYALSILIKHLSSAINRHQTLQEVLIIINEIVVESEQAKILSDLITNLNDDFKLVAVKNALTSALETKDQSGNFEIFLVLIPYLEEVLKSKVLMDMLKIAYDIKDPHKRAHALSALVKYLNKELLPQILRDAWKTAKETNNELVSTNVISSFAPYLYNNKELASQVFGFIHEINSDEERIKALSAFMPYITNDLRSQVIVIVGDIKDESQRAEALSVFVSHVDEELKVRMLAMAQEIGDDHCRAKALLNLSFHFNNELKKRILQEVLTATQKTGDTYERVRVLGDLSLYLDGEVRFQALQNAVATSRELDLHQMRPSFLSTFIRHPENEFEYKQVQDAIIAVRNGKDQSGRTNALTYLSLFFHKEKVAVLEEILYLQGVYFPTKTNLDLWKDIEHEVLEKNVFIFIRTMSKKDRRNGMATIDMWLSFFYRFLDKKALKELYRTITDVTRWWP